YLWYHDGRMIKDLWHTVTIKVYRISACNAISLEMRNIILLTYMIIVVYCGLRNESIASPLIVTTKFSRGKNCPTVLLICSANLGLSHTHHKETVHTRATWVILLPVS